MNILQQDVKPIMHALAWMSVALVSFCLMAIGARELSDELPVFQVLFFRSLVGLLCLSPILFFSKYRIKTNRLRLHTLRNIFHFGGQYGWFLGIGLLPLAEVFALEFTVPIWTLIIAAIFLGEKISTRKIISICLGTLGVIVIVQPGYAIFDLASLIVLVAAICYAVSHTATKSLSVSESAVGILFYMSLIQLPIGFLLSISGWLWPEGVEWFWLIVIGITGLSAHYCLVRAMKYTEITTIVTLDFLRLPLIALVGVLFYSEQFNAALLLGGVLVLIGNLVSIRKPQEPV